MELSEACAKIMEERREIIDLFCKAFLLSKDPRSIEEIKYIFNNFVLEERRMEDGLSTQFRLVPKDIE